MTNFERIIKTITIEKLAELMVNVNICNNGYYGYDGEDEYWIDNYVEEYTSCANEYSYGEFESCKNDLIEWLQKESEV